MTGVRSHEDLHCWQLAAKLRDRLYEIADRPGVRQDGKFCDQIRSAANSAVDRISEGFYRYHTLDHARFLGYARGSFGEIQGQLRHAQKRKYLVEPEFGEVWNLACRAMAATTKLQTYLLNCPRR
jgi:four helix bundle protein